jgi:hypothetical protein
MEKETLKQSVQEYEQQGLEKYSSQLEKETLEEAAGKLYPLTGEVGIDHRNYLRKEGFINGAKYQAERSYSEEEVLEHLNRLLLMPNSKIDTYTDDNEMMTNKWFAQFKKK